MSFSQMLFSFKGRLNRMPYWLATLGVSIVSILFQVIITMFVTVDPATGMPGGGAFFAILLVSLIFLWPSLAIGVKRCHDRDKTGWFLLVALIPVIGALWLLVDLGFLRGTEGDNRFGSAPLGGTATEGSWAKEPAAEAESET